VKFNSWAAGVAVLTLVAAPAFAEESAEEILEQWSFDSNVQTVACDSCGGGCGDGCQTGCGGDCSRGGILGAIEGLSLSAMLGMEDSGWDIGGWTQMGYSDDQVPLSTTRGDLRSFNDVQDLFRIQQQWFYIGKEADGSNGLDWGFRFDSIYGTDAQKTQAFSNPTGSFDEGWDNGIYGWAIPQLYVEVAAGDFSVKIGRFFTPVGYEVVPATGNFFYSHSLTNFNSEPFTHTGVLATYSGYENMTLYGGWTLGWDTGFDNVNSGSNFIGGASVDLMDSVTMTMISTYGNFGVRDGGGNNSYSHSIVFDVELTDRFNYVFQSDLVDANDVGVPNTNGFIENNQFGINQYLFYTWSDRLKLGNRIEWWKNGSTSHYAYTSGVNIQALSNVIIRPEYRRDWSPGSVGNNRETLGFDVILTY